MTAIRSKSIRTRLTVWYVAMLAALLVFYSVGTTLFLLRVLHRQSAAHLIEDLETIEGLMYLTPDGRLSMREDYHNHPQSKHVQERLVEVLSPQGEILYRNERLGDRALGGPPFPGEGVDTYSVRSGRFPDGTRLKLASRRHAIDGRLVILRLAYSEEVLWRSLQELTVAEGAGLLLTLALAGFVGYALARRVLAPLDEMARHAERITSARLDERLPNESNDDELGHLARVFNKTLARLEQSFEQLRRFTSDASHELRTPLTAIRTVGEVGLQKDGDRNQYREIVGSMLEEVNRLTRLVDSLLMISRADAGQISLERTEVAVLDLTMESARLFEVLVEERRLELSVRGDASAAVYADPLFLRQAVTNILHNAIKNSPLEGRVSIRVSGDEADWVVIEVEDEGPGIPAGQRERVFERFYRVDEGRSREKGGVGLGLSIAKWAIEAHGGTVSLREAPSRGCIFGIRLPSARHIGPPSGLSVPDNAGRDTPLRVAPRSEAF